jgi:hypothetical protein
LLPTTLPFWTALPALLAGLTVPGWLTLNLLLTFGIGKTKTAPGLLTRERIFITLALSLMLSGWFGLTLAQLGIYSLGALLLTLAVWSGAAGFWLWRRGFDFRGALRWKFSGKPEAVVAAVVIGGTALLYAYAPHETVMGSQDAGVYFNTGASIVRTGGILLQDPLLPTVGAAANSKEIGGKIISQVLVGVAKKEDRFQFVKYLRLPGFYIRDNDAGLTTGEVVPQFFHLFPAWLAIGFSLGGLRAETYVTPLLGILSVFAVYLTALRLFPARRWRWLAPLAAGFLALNGIQIWFSRYSMSEVALEFLAFVALYGFMLLLRPVAFADEENHDALPQPNLAILGAILAGAGFGMLCLTHAQFPFLVWALIPYFIWMRLSRRWGAPQWVLLATFGVFFAHTVLHIRIFSLAYFEGIYHNIILDIRRSLHIIAPVLSAGFFALVLIDAMPQRVRTFEGWLVRHKRFFAGGLALLTLGYLLFNYFGRVYFMSTDGQGNYPPYFWSLQSYIGAPTTEGPERTLLRLGWYFSPLAMLLIFAGAGWLIWKRLDARTGFFLAVVGGITLLFLDTNYTQESYIYSLRRYLVVTVPAFAIFLAYALCEVVPHWTQATIGFARRLSRRTVAIAATPGGNVSLAVMPPPIPEIVPDPEPEVPVNIVTGRPHRSLRIGWTLSAIVAALLFFFYVWTGRTIFTLSQYGADGGQPGAIAQLDELAKRFGEKDILLFAGSRDPDGKIATPLTYIYGRPAFFLTEQLKNDELAGLMRLWEAQGYKFKALLGPNGGRFFPTGYQLRFNSEFDFKLRQLEELEIQKPFNVQMNTLSYAIYDVVRADDTGFASSAGTGAPNVAGGWNLRMGQNDFATLVEGFYDWEKDPNGTAYRWTVLNGVLRIPCLAPEGSPAKISVTLGGGTRPPGSNARTTLYISNYRYSNDTKLWLKLGDVDLKSEPQTFTFDLPPGAPALSCARAETGDRVNSLFLWLIGDSSRTFTPSTLGIGNDPRLLSFKVYGVNLSNK